MDFTFSPCLTFSSVFPRKEALSTPKNLPLNVLGEEKVSMTAQHCGSRCIGIPHHCCSVGCRCCMRGRWTVLEIVMDTRPHRRCGRTLVAKALDCMHIKPDHCSSLNQIPIIILVAITIVSLSQRLRNHYKIQQMVFCRGKTIVRKASVWHSGTQIAPPLPREEKNIEESCSGLFV